MADKKISAAVIKRLPRYYRYLSELLDNGIERIEKGIFGADMKVSLVNDGPVTIEINTKDLKI